MTEMEIVEQLLAMGITGPNVLYVWSWGFGSVVLMWSLGYAVGAAVTAIRKL